MEFWEFSVEVMPALLEGTLVTLQLTAISIVLGFLFAIALAAMRSYGPNWLSRVAAVYITIIRGTPLLTQLFILYFGLPMIGISMTPFVAAVVGMSMNSAAYQAEYFRGAIQSIPAGQMTAARAIGLSKVKSVLHVILPQALVKALPAWSNELAYMIKYSSVAYVIQAPELMEAAKKISSETFMALEVYLLVAVIYMVIVAMATGIMRLVEWRVRVPGL